MGIQWRMGIFQWEWGMVYGVSRRFIPFTSCTWGQILTHGVVMRPKILMKLRFAALHMVFLKEEKPSYIAI